MADTLITALPTADAVAASDTLIVVQNGVTRQASVAEALAAQAAVTGIALDTDGVPYFNPVGTTTIALDTDGVPYLV